MSDEGKKDFPLSEREIIEVVAERVIVLGDEAPAHPALSQLPALREATLAAGLPWDVTTAGVEVAKAIGPFREFDREDYPVTHQISSPRGRRKAPARLLLDVAGGLARDHFWWEMSREARDKWSHRLADAELRERLGIGFDWEEVYYWSGSEYDDPFEPPQDVAVTFWPTAKRVVAITTLEECHLVWERLNVSTPTMRWWPGEITNVNVNRAGHYPSEMFVEISVAEGAEEGWIVWSTGKEEDRRACDVRFRCSSHIAAILSILPDAEDDGTLRRYIDSRVRWDARVSATIAKAREKAEKPEWISRVYLDVRGEDGGRIELIYDQGSPPIMRGEIFPSCWTSDALPRRSYDQQGELVMEFAAAVIDATAKEEMAAAVMALPYRVE